MTGTEPLNEDGSPPHCEAQTVKLEMEDKMVQIKNLTKLDRQLHIGTHRGRSDKLSRVILAITTFFLLFVFPSPVVTVTAFLCRLFVMGVKIAAEFT